MRIVVLGLSLSSAWGNGHATTYRALLRALADRGHDVLFLERDRPWYADHRDLVAPGYCELRLYGSLDGLESSRADVAGADLVVVGSYVPDGIAIGGWVQEAARGVTAFYDIDTPVTLAALGARSCEYLSADLVPGFHLYLSFTGGPTLRRLETKWGAIRARALYCAVDPAQYRPVVAERRWDMGYLGTYSPDRQPTVERLLNAAARARPARRFVVAGPQYPGTLDWPPNVERIEHLAPAAHAAFYSGLDWTLNATRADMRAAGFSPSVRLFEAAACACPIISDDWPGLGEVFRPGAEIAVAATTADVLACLDADAATSRAIGTAGRRRVLADHTAGHRAAALEGYVAEVAQESRGRIAG